MTVSSLGYHTYWWLIRQPHRPWMQQLLYVGMADWNIKHLWSKYLALNPIYTLLIMMSYKQTTETPISFLPLKLPSSHVYMWCQLCFYHLFFLLNSPNFFQYLGSFLIVEHGSMDSKLWRIDCTVTEIVTYEQWTYSIILWTGLKIYDIVDSHIFNNNTILGAIRECDTSWIE